MKRILNLLALCAVTYAINSQAQMGFENEYVDDNTKLTGELMTMHICPTGFMSGFHEHRNDLLCFYNYGYVYYQGGLNDHNTKRSGMHACPLGTAMVGIHVKNNVLRCDAPEDGLRIDTNSEYVSYGGSATLRYGMHACPEGWVMTGIHVVGNRFLCSLVTR